MDGRGDGLALPSHCIVTSVLLEDSGFLSGLACMKQAVILGRSSEKELRAATGYEQARNWGAQSNKT